MILAVVVLVYIIGAFIASYLLGRYGDNEDYEFTMAIFWPLVLIALITVLPLWLTIIGIFHVISYPFKKVYDLGRSQNE